MQVDIIKLIMWGQEEFFKGVDNLKRPILIAVIGYIIGIIVGLYFKISIVPFYILLIVIYFIYKNFNKQRVKKFQLLSIKRYSRYIKLYLNSKVIILLIISSVVSNIIVNFQNKNYEKIYNTLSTKENLNFTGVIISEKQEKKYYNKYKIKINYNNQKIKFYITTKKDIQLEYGDKISFLGAYEKPEIQRNYNGFNYLEYLKQLKIYGTIRSEKVQVLSKRQANVIFQISNYIHNKIVFNVKNILDDETASILLGLILGDKQDLDEEIQENFRNAGMAHVLAISGMHVAYVILGISFIFKKIIGKRNTNILNIVILIFYMFLTNFSSSITRAGIMGIIVLFSKIIHRKNDIYTSISISLLLILIYNSFLIKDLGLLLSYGGVIGIVVFNRSILKVLENIKVKNKVYKYKIKPRIQKYLDKIEEIISVSISVQITIFPIIIYNLNTVNPYFLITNLFLSFVIGPIVIVCFLFIIICLNSKITQIFVPLISLVIKILNYISNIGKLPFSKIYIATPNLFSILSYYLFLIVLFLSYNLYSYKKPNKTQIRVKNLIALMKIKFRKNKKRIKALFISIFVFIFIIKMVPQNLKIHFVDVGQGDSTFIVTPHNKTILIDGGGSSSSDFDVGESTLIPYILDRGFTKIDIVIISHFDQDHVGGILTVLQELKVKNVYISKQTEKSDNYEKFLKIVNDKKIKVYEIIAGNKIKIEKDMYLDILWPKESQIMENVLNNNAVVYNLHYKKFSMLFTGDIEKIAEEQILDLYSQNKNELKTDILKVGHHGSKTSSTSEFLNVVNPKIAVIGVGKNNKFGHPNDGVLKRFDDLNCKVYRTDLNGEISIEINRNSKFKIKTQINV